MVTMKKLEIIEFDWDKGNIDKNRKQHQVNYRECEQIFFNKPIKFFYDEEHSRTEHRFLTYGKTDLGRKLTIVFTWRKGKIRVISARDQNIKERRVYEKNY